jgi:hypothetical protein
VRVNVPEMLILFVSAVFRSEIAHCPMDGASQMNKT